MATASSTCSTKATTFFTFHFTGCFEAKCLKVFVPMQFCLLRYDHATFFPSSEDANFDMVGEGAGKGFNVNIPFNARKMGNAEYLLAFQSIVLPIAYEFNPQLVLVSAGFDAVKGDPLGGYRLSPAMYGHMTQVVKLYACLSNIKECDCKIDIRILV